MAVSRKIINFLEKNRVKFELLDHKTVYTAYDKAATLKIAEKTIGKTLLVRVDRNPVLVLISANKSLDKQKLKKTSKAKKVDFIKEAWMKKNLKGIKVGAIPPFGSLWKFPTFIDRGIMRNRKIIVNSGDYNKSIKINPAVFKKINPDLVIGSFSKAKK